jgi:hypothetical protein
MTANRLKYKVWVNEDIDDNFDGPENGILKKGWLAPQCKWFQLAPNGQELLWSTCEECLEPLVIGRDVTVLFSTGLLDSKGVEIYEGDILSSGSADPEIEQRLNVVKWAETSYNSFFDFGSSSAVRLTTIIGNIYEHPALLEGK